MMAPSGVQVMCGLVLLFSGKPVVSAPFNRGAATVSLTANGPCGGAMLIHVVLAIIEMDQALQH